MPIIFIFSTPKLWIEWWLVSDEWSEVLSVCKLLKNIHSCKSQEKYFITNNKIFSKINYHSRILQLSVQDGDWRVWLWLLVKATRINLKNNSLKIFDEIYIKHKAKVWLLFLVLICDCYWLAGLTTGRGNWPPVLQSQPPLTSAHFLSQDISTLLITRESVTPLHSSLLDSALTRCKWSHGIFLFSLLWGEVNHNLWSEETLNETNSWVQHFPLNIFLLFIFSWENFPK